MKTIIRSRYDDHSQYQKETEGISTEPSQTQQQFAQESDINWILDKYKKTGILPNLKESQGSYGDYTNIPDFHQAQNIIQKAQVL